MRIKMWIPLLLLNACTKEPKTIPLVPASANYTGALGADPDFSGPSGLFHARFLLSESIVQLNGAFADGPPVLFHYESDREGSCRVMAYTPSSCDPACAPSEGCVEGVCVPYPLRTPRGPLAWTHPGGTTTIDPDGTDGYFGGESATEEGEMTLGFDEVLLEVPVAPTMEPEGDWQAELQSRGSADGVVRWTNPQEGARVRLHMTDCVGSHGGLAAAEIQCEAPDTGELVIPAAFMDLFDSGDWGSGECGDHVFHRYHGSAPVGDATIRFEARSWQSLWYRPE